MNQMKTRPYCLVVGDPIEHSLSPIIHSAAYKELGLSWDFYSRQVPQGNLRFFLESLSEDCRGLAVTMPLKPEALQIAAYIDGLAKVTGVVNTLVPASGGTWTGFNTDVSGIVASFRSRIACRQRGKAVGVVFGSGSTAASAIAAFTQLGMEQLFLVSRQVGTACSALQAANRMGVNPVVIAWENTSDLSKILKDSSLIMSTVPGHLQAKLALPLVETNAVVLEAAYSPWPTPVAVWAGQCGANVIPGWEMLLNQAVLQIKLFSGEEISADALKLELEAEIGFPK